MSLFRFIRSLLGRNTKSVVGIGNAGRIIWVDCEMTGLDVNSKSIVEIACVVTEADLTVMFPFPNSQQQIIEEGVSIVISQSQDALEEMDDWCKTTFSANGLLQEIFSSTITMQEAENEVLTYVRRHTSSNVCPLAGNSVGIDRIFLQKFMPTFANHLHYRTIDVSSVKELVRRWYPWLITSIPQKQCEHRALDDIYESIKELQWYKKNIFIP
ncbi:unnamed protein product [Thelazia callipaeda]|uniref:Probable oligoribonuclease n=1 Tax=Thelazia callipaeda TaxID=103827 RepID=A0A0N5D4J5_THECL|nr:unnamed protein product [Thelazia callipaeda]